MCPHIRCVQLMTCGRFPSIFKRYFVVGRPSVPVLFVVGVSAPLCQKSLKELRPSRFQQMGLRARREGLATHQSAACASQARRQRRTFLFLVLFQRRSVRWRKKLLPSTLRTIRSSYLRNRLDHLVRDVLSWTQRSALFGDAFTTSTVDSRAIFRIGWVTSPTPSESLSQAAPLGAVASTPRCVS